MTLQNGIIKNEAVYLYCDTAVIGMEGRDLVGFHSKAVQGRKLPFAITCSFVGAKNLPATMESLMSAIAWGVVDSTWALSEVCRDWLMGWRASHDGVARLLIGCCFPDEGPQLAIISTDDLGFVRPFQAASVEAYVSSANNSSAYNAFVHSADRRASMLAVIDAQRAEPMLTVDGGPPCHGIGGAVIEIEGKRCAQATAVQGMSSPTALAG